MITHTSKTNVERTSDREIVVTRTIDGPRHLVFKAWSDPELFKKWWVPKSVPMTLLECDMDVRTGGSYRLLFGMGDQKMEFFGKYIEVIPPARIVWTNEEGGPEATAITTVTFEERDGKTLLTMHDLHPTKESLDEAISSGATAGTPEQWDQLADLIAAL